MNLNETFRVISPALKEAFEQTILPNVADTTKDYLYSTLFTVILKDANKIVGDLCIIGEPISNGAIEIGYGTCDEFRAQGFMTEAVGGMIAWAKLQPKIFSNIASTKKENIASYRILLKNNFIKIGETGTLFNWKLTIK